MKKKEIFKAKKFFIQKIIKNSKKENKKNYFFKNTF